MSGNEQTLTTGGNKQPSVSAWFRSIGEWRDGILVFGGATYGLGYLVWSIHAKNENLGLLPALEPQYLAAGVIPMLLIWLAYLGFRGAIQFPGTVAKWRDRQAGKWPAVLRGLGLACFVTEFGVVVWIDHWQRQRHLTRLSTTLQFVVVLSQTLLFPTGVSLWFVYPSGEQKQTSRWADRLQSAFLRGYTKFVTFICVAAFLSSFAVIYVLVLYPAVPQEFGGVRPRCAFIDVAKDQVSGATRKEILPYPAESTGNVAQSYRMTVYFSGSDFMLARRAPGEPPAGQPEPPKSKLFELRKEVIKAVHWCD